jgi:hypothetical protein
MRNPRLILVLATALFVTGCTSKPRDMCIVGGWEGVRQAALNVEIAIEYREDGTVKARTRTLGILAAGSGTYKFLDDHTIVQELTFKGDNDRTIKETQQVSFNDGVMTQTDESGIAVKFRQVGSADAPRSGTFWADFQRGYRETDPAREVGRWLDWLNGYVVRWPGLLACLIGILIMRDLYAIQQAIRSLSERLSVSDKWQAKVAELEARLAALKKEPAERPKEESRDRGEAKQRQSASDQR